MNNQHPKYHRVVERLIGKGTILDWREDMESYSYKDNKATLRVTSFKLNSWGSIYINLSVVGEGRYYDRSLQEHFKSIYDTTYEQTKKRNQFKWTIARRCVHQELKLLGVPHDKIFVKRLTFLPPKK